MPPASQVLERATIHHQAGRITEAERDYLEILESEGGNADALRLLGALYIQTNRLDRAVGCLEKAHFVQPENAETLNNLAVALRKCGRLEDAIRRYEQALQIDPHFAQALDNLGSAYYERGRVDDAIVLHRQALQIQPNSPESHFNLANALRDRKNPTEAIAHYERALHLRPFYAEALVNLGIVLAAEDRRDEAAMRFEMALRVSPKNFRALNNLGILRRHKGEMENAAAFYRRALAIKPDYAEAHANLGTVLRDMGKTDEAMRAYEQALRIKPDFPDALSNLGLLLQNGGKIEEAIAYYDEALALKPDLTDAKWNKALALLALGRYREGWELHETGLGGKRGKLPFYTHRWDGRELSGERLLISSEQGLGDCLQFVRYAALCKEKGATVIVQAPQPLLRLLQNCPYIDEVVTTATEGDFDFHVSMMSLPYIFDTELGTIPAATPYLYVDEASRQKWAAKFSGVDDYKIGLVWAGNARLQNIDAHLIDRRRSLGLAQMQPLLGLDQIRFYNLQAGPPAAEIDKLEFRGRLIDHMKDVEDFLDTAALIENLDLVITVDTSVAHLAGALGKPVWILSRFDACWRWLQNREKNPWYPSARIFGQSEAGDWEKVVGEIREVLCQTRPDRANNRS